MIPTLLVCPHCGEGNERHTNAGPLPTVPHDDDVSLCWYCGQWSIFDGGTLRVPTVDEAARMAINPEICHAYYTWVRTRIKAPASH